MRCICRWSAVILLAVGGMALLSLPAVAEGTNLDGRMAPDMTFQQGTNGVQPGLSLSALKGRPVWLKFILRDCPRCQRELPRAQQVHEKWGRSGLIVLVVVHQLGPEEMRSYMQRHGFTFPLGTDPSGDFARRYGVRHRPADYVIGVDGRVRASNSAPEQVLLTELGRYRLARLGSVPTELEDVRKAVWNWDYGKALRTVEAAAGKADASEETRSVAERVRTLAREELEARVANATVLEQRRRIADARAIYDLLTRHFAGTPLASDVEEAKRAFVARTQGR